MSFHTDKESYELGELYGVGAYAKIPERDKALIAFGMTNVTLVEQADKDNAEIMPHLNRAEFMRGFSVGLMTAAKAKGKMIA